MGVYWLKMLHPPPKLALSEKYANSAQTYGRGDTVDLVETREMVGLADVLGIYWPPQASPSGKHVNGRAAVSGEGKKTQ
jgi:hypothetical protein